MRLLPLLLAAALLSACGSRPADDTAAAPAPVPATAPGPAPPPAASPASPQLLVATLVAPGTDSPFRWDAVEPGPPRTRIEDSVLWAPAAPVLHALQPGGDVEVVDGRLVLDGVALGVPTRVVDGETWVDVSALAKVLGGYARHEPGNGSVVLWPQPALEWLANHGDPRAPVLLEARAAGIVP